MQVGVEDEGDSGRDPAGAGGEVQYSDRQPQRHCQAPRGTKGQSGIDI